MKNDISIDANIWQKLIDPISSSDDPCGSYLIYEKEYDDIKSARDEDDPSLPQGIWQKELKKADWHKVENICIDALTNKTKDLQIASWLMESWCKLYGISGLFKGTQLIKVYVDKFWKDVHPHIHEDDIEFRMAPFDWLNEKFAEKIPLMYITDRDSGDNYSLIDWQNANKMQSTVSLVDNKGKDSTQDVITITVFKEAFNKTPLKFYQNFVDNLQRCIDNITSIESVIYENHKDLPSYLYNFKNHLNSLIIVVKNLLKEKQPMVQEMSAKEPVDNIDATYHKSGLQITCREEAYEQLGEIASYLSRIEPHSPTPYLLQRAVSWGDMSVVELLEEIVKDKGDYQSIMQLLGVGKNT
jgi:type VI secretion system protein ImpA